MATQALCEGSAFLRNLVLARLIGADEMGLAVALALAIRIFEMAGELGLDRLLVQVEDKTLPRMRQTVHLLQLAKGSVVELDRLAGEPLDVLVNGTLVARGEVVVVNDKFGVRLSDVISQAERVKSLK